MQAKELAKILMENPESYVVILDASYSGTPDELHINRVKTHENLDENRVETHIIVSH